MPARPTKPTTPDTARWALGTFKTKRTSVLNTRVPVSAPGPVGSQLLSNLAANTLVGANNAGHDESTTHAAVSEAR
ncbi:hypothetical protein QPK13_06240 [Photorhabdus tasmaniensis]